MNVGGGLGAWLRGWSGQATGRVGSAELPEKLNGAQRSLG